MFPPHHQGEPYNFTHLLIVSRVYHLSEDEEAALANAASNRKRGTGGDASPKKQRKQRPESAQNVERPADGIYSYHPEDDIIMTVSSFYDFWCYMKSS